MAHTLSTCTFCGVGCGLYLETAGNQVAGVYPSFSHPANRGKICARGWHVHEVASSPDRLKKSDCSGAMVSFMKYRGTKHSILLPPAFNRFATATGPIPSLF